MIATLIGGLIIILIGFSLYKPIVQQVQAASMNVTGSVGTLLQLLPGFFVLMVSLTAMAIGANALRDAGLIGGKYQDDYEEDFEEKKAKDRNHHQTYKEYVQERLEVEGMLK